ncbi:acyltransferase domain-containing protein, partial [Streptomyces luteolus]
MPLTFSARGEQPVRELAASIRDFLTQNPEIDPADAARALLVSRTVFEHRAVLLAADRDGLVDALDALAADRPDPRVVSGAVPAAGAVDGAVFVFPGQGSQWVGMALELLETSEVFRERMHECAAALAEFADWSLLDVLHGTPGAPGFDRVDVVQPVLFAVMVSLAALWQSLGVRPAAVVGHSQGEIAAACVAGALSLRDAARVVALRSLAIAGLAGSGGMVSVPLPAGRTQELIGRWGDRLAVAAVNGPGSSVVSGDPEALDELLAACADQDVRARRIPVDYASHSAHVETLEEQLRELLAPVAPREGAVPFYSAVTGGRLDHLELDGAYWYRNLRQPVRFDTVTRALLDEGHRVFVESSAHPVLTTALQDSFAAAEADNALAVGSLRRDEGGMGRFLSSAATGYVHGLPVDWSAVLGGAGTAAARTVALPTYPFQHRSYWLEAEAKVGDMSDAGLRAAGHPLLGAAVELGDGQGLLFTGRLSLRTHPWLADHTVDGTVLLPGTAFVDLALHAGQETGCEHVEDLTVLVPLLLTEHTPLQLQLVVGALDSDGKRALTVHSKPDTRDDAQADEPWTRHATGVLAEGVRAEAAAGPAGGEAWEAAGTWPPAGAAPADLDRAYERLAARGYEYGPAFQGLRTAWQLGDEVYAEVALDAEAGTSAEGFGLHPALLDSALHPAVLGLLGQSDEGLLPFSWTGVSLHAEGAGSLRVRLRTAGRNTVSVSVADALGAPVATVDALALRPVDKEALRAAGSQGRQPLLVVEWRAMSALTSREQASPGEVGAEARVFRVPGGSTVREVTGQVLAAVQDHLTDTATTGPLLVLTRGAVSTGHDDEVTDPTAAAAWG